MIGYIRALGTVSVILMAGCSATPIEYKSNEALEGPGLFESAFPFSINRGSSEAENQVAPRRDLRDTSGQASSEDLIGECQKLVREFEAFNNFKNFSKESSEYEEFLQWLDWRNQRSNSAGR